MRMILLTVGTLISLAVSTLTAGAWWYTDETADGSLMLINAYTRHQLYLTCKLDTDEKRHVRYSIQFQPPVPPIKDLSGIAIRYRMSGGPIAVQPKMSVSASRRGVMTPSMNSDPYQVITTMLTVSKSRLILSIGCYMASLATR